MEFAESLERAHRKDGRETNIYVEHPLRTCRSAGSIPQSSPDPPPSGKANCCVFTPPVGLLQLPVDHVSKEFVCSSSSDSKSPQTMSYHKFEQDGESLRTELLHPTEGLLSTADNSPPVHVTCYRTPDDDLHQKPIIKTGFLQPSSGSLPWHSDGEQAGYYLTPSPDQQTHDDLDAGGVAQQKISDRQVVVTVFRPRRGKPRKVHEWTEDRVGYETRGVLDIVSCLCCVKAFFYHCCSDEDDDTHCSDTPCSCTGRPLCCQRWTCLVLASITCLPCLVLYWPVRIILRLVARCRGVCPRNRCSCA